MDDGFLHPWLDKDRQRVSAGQAVAKHNVLLSHYRAPALKPDGVIKSNRWIEHRMSIADQRLRAQLPLAQP